MTPLYRNCAGMVRRDFIQIGLGGALGLGFDPYVTNTLSRGHPFHPVAGPGAVDFLRIQLAPGFHDHSRPVRLAVVWCRRWTPSTWRTPSKRGLRRALFRGVANTGAPAGQECAARHG